MHSPLMKLVFCCTCALAAMTCRAENAAAPTAVSADEVIDQCWFEPKARSGRSTIKLTVANMAGDVTKERTMVMFWKIAGEEDVFARQTIYVTAPPEFKYNAYLRWEPPLASAKPPDQWVYLTNTQKTRRIATRDPEDLTWGLIGEDLKLMQWPESTKTLLRTVNDSARHTYDVELIPTSKESLYGKIVARFERGVDWSSCAHSHSTFFDRDGGIIKEIETTWGTREGQRIRESIVISSTKSKTKTTYKFEDTVLDPPLDDHIFTARALAHAERYLGNDSPH